VPEELETAIVLVLTEHSAELSALHAHYQPEVAAKGVPLHITLLYPFVPPRAITPELISTLRGFFAGRASPSFELTRIDAFPGVLYAAPEPARELVDLTEALARLFPDSPPYGGAFAEVVPHATLGEVGERAEQERLAAELREAAAPLLPVACDLTHASLLEEDEADRWRERERFAFATT
jgi:2'-5' RNA ligase